MDSLVKRCGNARKEDIVATATEITARSIADAVRSLLPKSDDEPKRYHDYIVSGGGARNKTLMQWVRRELEPFGLRIRTTDEMGLLSEAKEAVAFAVLAYQTWRREPSNIPSATGATRPAILGKVSHA